MSEDAASVIKSLAGALDPAAEGEVRGAAAIRLRFRLQPAGGPGTKVMPPTYAPEHEGGPPRYVREERTIAGEAKPCVSLDSVASQANRLEVALSGAIDTGELHVPNIWVDQAEFGLRSALDFSHRAFDAWIEDAELEDGTPFGQSDLWRQLAASQRRDLSALMAHCPTSVLLGSWASRAKNPQGTTRLARILTSEIIGVGYVEGHRAAGRIDVHNVSSDVTIYAGKTARIVTNPRDARGGPMKPVKFPSRERVRAGKPSAAGYGNVTPSLAQHGGVTIDYALQIATLSLPALRECRFPENGHSSPERDIAGRVMLAALGLRMLALQVDRGYDLRSGCLLVPESEPSFELVDRLGRVTVSWPAISLPTQTILDAAVANGKSNGLDWSDGDINLRASEAQLYLLRQSLEHAEVEEG